MYTLHSVTANNNALFADVHGNNAASVTDQKRTKGAASHTDQRDGQSEKVHKTA